eukprot:237733-Chlamydomonas_euryale.AAC.12
MGVLMTKSKECVPQEAYSGPDELAALRESCAARQVWILPAFETSKQVDLDEGVAIVSRAITGGRHRAAVHRMQDLTGIHPPPPYPVAFGELMFYRAQFAAAAPSARTGSKADLGPFISDGKLQPFAAVAYAKGHACTDFIHWYTIPDSSHGAYGVELSVNCEPWFIIDRRLCPPYDSRFRGYGWNKVQQVALVNASGFSFHVHPAAFLVHRPHPKSQAQGIYKDASSNAGGGVSPAKLFHRKVAQMRHLALRDMKRGTYVAVTDAESDRCKVQLSWWREGT